MTDDAKTGEKPATTLETFLTYRLARVQSKLNIQAARILRDHAGLTLTQWRIIAFLGELTSCTAAQMSRMSAMDKGLISRTIKTLSANGYISVTPDAHDNRALYLALTQAGREMYTRTIPRMQARQAALRSHLTPDEEEVLLRALGKLEGAADNPDV